MGEHAARPEGGRASSEPGSAEPSTGALIAQLSEQSSSLVRSELQLATAETRQKARHAGVRVGKFGAAGVVALFGTVILGLTLVSAPGLRPWWFLVAGVVALLGRRRVSRATPVTPERTIDGLKRDVETVEGGGHRDHTG